MEIPTRKQWQDLKNKHEVATGAVSGIDVGGELDKYAKAKTMKERAAILPGLEVKLANYISKLDEKKVKKDYKGFQKEFLDKYVGVAHKHVGDIKRYKAGEDEYRKELAKYFAMAQKFGQGTPVAQDFQRFQSGPQRGLSAMGRNVQGPAPAEVDLQLAKIQKGISGLKATPSDEELKALKKLVLAASAEIGKIAKKYGFA